MVPLSRCVVACVLAWFGVAALQAQSASPVSTAQPARPSAQAATDLDAFMQRVLQRRDEAWRKLHDYVLSETERFEIVGPGDVRLHGMKREFAWYVRDGYLVRSPVRYDGVAIGEADRRRYEERWLQDEKKREAKSREKKAGRDETGTRADQGAAPAPASGDPALQPFVDQRGEPRFISEAYFMQFHFEPGNYYLAGRETLEGREVVKVEYYPTRLFQDDRREGTPDAERGHRRPQSERDRQKELEYERKFNKVALVTLWVDPKEYQIVKYTFDNIDFAFLPGRALVRLDEVRATMTMAPVLDGVWLPRAISMRGGFTLANGSYHGEYAREFHDYKKAETAARIRSMVPKDPEEN